MVPVHQNQTIWVYVKTPPYGGTEWRPSLRLTSYEKQNVDMPNVLEILRRDLDTVHL